MPVPSPAPVRFPSGVSTDYPWQLLADYGGVNPAKYHTFFDDFNVLSTLLTATKSNAGTLASAAGDGGRILATTDALVGDYVSLSPPFAGFKLVAGKKAFFGARIKLAAVSTPAIRMGLVAATTTPFTAPADGIYLDKATGTSVVTIKHAIGSATESGTVPAASFSLTNATDVDMGFTVSRRGEICVFIGANLFGWLPQTGESPALAHGPIARLSPASLTQVVLMPIIGVQSGTASAKTMEVDLMFAAVER